MTNKKQNLNPAPKLKKKNGIWRTVLVPAISFLLGGVAVVGLINGVPTVNNALIKHDMTPNNTPGTNSPSQDDSDLQEEIENLQQSLNKLSTELSQTKNQLNTSNSLVVNKELEVQQLKTEKDNLTTELKKAKENAVLYEQTQQQLAEITSALETAQLELEQARIDNNLSAEEIASLEQNVTDLTNEKTSLESTISNLDAEIEYYKELLGDDINYANLVVELQTSLDEKTSALETTSAELETLTSEHNELLTLVAELHTELAQVKEQLSNYVSSSTLDKLQIENYDGTWYLNGTFEDYLVIENGIVTRGLNIDSGALQVMYNEMFMLLNNGGGQKITLADNGSKIILANGSEFTKFVVNTSVDCDPIYSMFCKTFSNNHETITFNNDSTLKYIIDNNEYYGSYVVNAIEKNIGGNIFITQNIVASINFTNEQLVYNFTISNDSGVLFNANTGLSYTPITPYSKQNESNTLKLVYDNLHQYIVTIKMYTPKKINDWDSLGNAYAYLDTNNYSSNYADLQVGNNKLTCSSTTNKFTSSGVSSQNVAGGRNIEYVVLGIGNAGYLRSLTNLWFDFGEIVSISENYSFTGSNKMYLPQVLKDKIGSNPYSEFNFISCKSIPEYYVGSYLNEETVISLVDDGTATIGELTGTYTATAKTDGTNIVHTVTVTYEETQIAEDDTEVTVTHTLTFDLINNTFVPANAILDGNEISLVKANG